MIGKDMPRKMKKKKKGDIETWIFNKVEYKPKCIF
jgi:hypothetical protein